MNARFVRECIGPDDRLVRRNLRTSNFRKEPAGGKQLAQIDVRLRAKAFFADSEQNRNLFERSISSAFADAVHGALNLPYACSHRRKRVRHGQSEIVMAMRAQRYFRGIVQEIADSTKHLAAFFRDGITT